MAITHKTRFLVLAAGVLLIVTIAGLLRFRGNAPETGADRQQEKQSTLPGVRGLPTDHTTGPSAFAPKRDWDAVDDPASDGWDSEVFAGEAQAQLHALGKIMQRPRQTAINDLQTIAVPEFIGHAPRDSDLHTAFRDPLFHVQRGNPSNAPAVRGLDGLATMLSALTESFQDVGTTRIKFSIIRVTPADERVTTRQLFSISGRTPAGITEIHATWNATWEKGTGKPRLQSLRIVDQETVTSTHPDGPLFSDCTASVLAHNNSWTNQLLVGLGHWLKKTEEEVNLSYLGTPGIAIGDVNGDGLDDLYLCQARGLPNRLFIQHPDGTATESSSLSAVDWLENSRAALFADLDNDGDQDLVVAVVGAILFASNNGSGVFSIEEISKGGMDATSLAAADVDADGDLDIYQCVYHRSDVFSGANEIIASSSSKFVYHDANNAGRNQLLRNDGEWTFTDITEEAGLDVLNRRFSYAALFTDYDGDGDPDLYVANDFGRDSLYRNDLARGTDAKFVYVSKIAGADPGASGMGITGGDVDRDGDLDIYIANMFSSAGGRIAYQQQFKADATPQVRSRIQRFARGNTLLQNQGNGTFQDISEAAAVTVGRWAWGTQFADINNDGWEDLVVVNGFISNEDSGDL